MKKSKNLDKARRLSLIFTPHFPYNSGSKKGKHTAVLGIGGNVGDVLRRFEHLFWYLRRSRLVHIEETSPVLRNPPFGYTDQPDFYNAVIRVKTDLPPLRLLRFVLRTEARFGRRRSFKNAPRTLDIDVLLYDGRQMNHRALTLPHPYWHTRESVLVPMQYMTKVM